MFILSKQKKAPRKTKTICLDNLFNKIFYKSFECEICHEKTPLFAESHFNKNICCMCEENVGGERL